MEPIAKILELLSSPTFLAKINSGIDFFSSLDGRETPEFDRTWIAAYDELKLSYLTESQSAHLDQIRKKAYLSCLEVTGSADMAGYVSDDFELIVRAIFNDSGNLWISALAGEYLAGGFPQGTIMPSEVGVKKLFDCE
jgi:hypothetical protein